MKLAAVFNSIADFCSWEFDIVNDQLRTIRHDKYSTCNYQEAINISPVQSITWGE